MISYQPNKPDAESGLILIFLKKYPDLSGKEKWKIFSIVNQWLTVKKS